MRTLIAALVLAIAAPAFAGDPPKADDKTAPAKDAKDTKAKDTKAAPAKDAKDAKAKDTKAAPAKDAKATDKPAGSK